MSWSERHEFFERLLAMRDSYAGSDDRTGVISMADTVRYAEAVMATVDLDLEPWQAEIEQALSDDPAADREWSDETAAAPAPAPAAKPLPPRTGRQAPRRRLLGDVEGS